MCANRMFGVNNKSAVMCSSKMFIVNNKSVLLPAVKDLSNALQHYNHRLDCVMALTGYSVNDRDVVV